jgi:hypothetical protein
VSCVVLHCIILFGLMGTKSWEHRCLFCDQIFHLSHVAIDWFFITTGRL